MKRVLTILGILLMCVILYACTPKPCEHNYYLSDYYPARSGENGYNEYTCMKCNDKYKEIIPALKSGNVQDHVEEEGGYSASSKSHNLFDMPIYSDNNANVEYMDVVMDSKGYKHENCYIVFANSVPKDDHWETYFRYDLDGKYSMLKGSIYLAKYGVDVAWVEFYDGEDFLFSTNKINSENYCVDFEFSITGVDYLTIYPKCGSNSGDIIVDQIMISK